MVALTSEAPETCRRKSLPLRLLCPVEEAQEQGPPKPGQDVGFVTALPPLPFALCSPLPLFFLASCRPRCRLEPAASRGLSDKWERWVPPSPGGGPGERRRPPALALEQPGPVLERRPVGLEG